MADTHQVPTPSGTWGMLFIAGVAAGAVLGWVARSMVRTLPRRQPTRRVNPIQVQLHLKGVDYPVGKHGLLAWAQAAGADPRVLETLSRLPEHRYTSPIEVSRALGKRAS
jgi:hypothetical protein